MTTSGWPSRLILIVLLVLSLLVRGAWVLYQAQERQGSEQLGRISVDIGDTHTYIEPVEALIHGEGYTPDYRMPGVGAPYFIFRQFWNAGTARDAYVVLQLLLSATSVVLLALLAFKATGKVRVFYAVYALYLVSTYTSLYNATIGSDSLAVSAIIIHLYLLEIGLSQQRKTFLVGAGFFLTWAIFAKPVLVPLLALALLFVFIRTRRSFSFWAALCVIAPFMLIDGAWVVRNYVANGGFYPLTNKGMFSSSFMGGVRYRAMRFVQGYGGDYIWWNPGADIRWYGVWDKCAEVDQEGRSVAPPAAHAYAPGYSPDSLIRLSEDVRALGTGTLSKTDSAELSGSIVERFDRYALAYRTERPFQFHVVSRLRMVCHSFYQNGTESLFARSFGELPVWAQVFKLGQSALYALTFLLGTIGALVIWWRSRTTPGGVVMLLASVALYTTFIHPIGLRMCEWRYLATAFPFVLVLAVISIEQLLSWRSKALGHAAH